MSDLIERSEALVLAANVLRTEAAALGGDWRDAGVQRAYLIAARRLDRLAARQEKEEQA